jgi:hypothetical protein
MEKFVTFIIGILLGALSWGMADTVSGTFEPFDSDTGFLVTQVILSFAALMFGLKKGIIASVIFVAGGYMGMNAYAYAFGGSEARAWAMLGVVTTIGLVVFPALAGLLGGIVGRWSSKHRFGKAKRGQG